MAGLGTWFRSGSRRAAFALAMIGVVVGLAGCGDTPTEPMTFDLEGTWQQRDPGVSETSIRLHEDGTFRWVMADLAGGACTSSAGRWSSGETLMLEVSEVDNAPAPGSADYSFTLGATGLQLEGGTSAGMYERVGTMPSCVDYGFGAWEGSLTAVVDGEEVLFTVLEVDIEVDVGTATIVGEDDDCTACPDGRREILLRIDSQPEPLSTGAFMVDNDPGARNTFYGLYHPDPGSTTFTGFDTTRLAPPGTLAVTAIGPERIRGTFGFRANPRLEGQSGPGGETFALIEAGQIALVYR